LSLPLAELGSTVCVPAPAPAFAASSAAFFSAASLSAAALSAAALSAAALSIANFSDPDTGYLPTSRDAVLIAVVTASHAPDTPPTDFAIASISITCAS
jgi:hypothetical protein